MDVNCILVFMSGVIVALMYAAYLIKTKGK